MNAPRRICDRCFTRGAIVDADLLTAEAAYCAPCAEAVAKTRRPAAESPRAIREDEAPRPPAQPPAPAREPGVPAAPVASGASATVSTAHKAAIAAPAGTPSAPSDAWKLVVLYQPRATRDFMEQNGWRALGGGNYDRKVPQEQLAETLAWAKQRGSPRAPEVKSTTPPEGRA